MIAKLSDQTPVLTDLKIAAGIEAMHAVGLQKYL
jgi:hypothetical protein